MLRRFQLIDLDRTLFDTSLFVRLICDAVDEYEPGLGAEIDRRFEESYRKEEVFFALEFIRQKLGEEKYNLLLGSVLKHTDVTTLMLPGLKERIAFADTFSTLVPGYGVFSYSEYPEDQYVKLKLIGLEHVPAYIGDTADKAKTIASWQLPDGTFKLPEAFGGQIVDELTLEDDKLRAFTDLPDGVTGVWITSDPAARQKVAAFGGRVTPANGLIESIEVLRNI